MLVCAAVKIGGVERHFGTGFSLKWQFKLRVCIRCRAGISLMQTVGLGLAMIAI